MEIAISLILTIFVYLAFPVIYSCSKGKVPTKQGKKFALWNSIICATIFCIIRAVISGGQTVVTSLAPSVLYYFIAKAILIDKSLDNSTDNDKSNKTDNNK